LQLRRKEVDGLLVRLFPFIINIEHIQILAQSSFPGQVVTCPYAIVGRKNTKQEGCKGLAGCGKEILMNVEQMPV
jgi:nitrogen fixation protein FixH